MQSKLTALEAENQELKEQLAEAERKYKAALRMNIQLGMATLDLTEELTRLREQRVLDNTRKINYY